MCRNFTPLFMFIGLTYEFYIFNYNLKLVYEIIIINDLYVFKYLNR